MSDSDMIIKKAVEAAQAAPPVPTRTVPYGPVPTAWNISQAQSAEGTVIVVAIQTPSGDSILFIQPSVAKQLGEALVKMGSAAESGLIVPQ